MGTHLYDSFHSLERILEGYQETRKEVLTMFGGHVEFNGCKLFVNKSACISPPINAKFSPKIIT